MVVHGPSSTRPILKRSPAARVRTFSTVLIVVGVGLIVFPVLWIVYTAMYVGPIQASALAVWDQNAAEQSITRADAPDAAEHSTALVLTIPRLRLTRYVPEGASVPQLRRFGVGRISWTSLPDRPGMLGIAGHRTTYGAPFFRLAKLERGDHILISYAGRQYDYTVTERRVVRPTEVDVLGAVPGERTIALITCTPVYSARNRLVVLGRMQAVSSLSANP